MCCGSKRSAWRSAQAQAPARPRFTPAPAASAPAPVSSAKSGPPPQGVVTTTLRYVGGAPTQTVGRMTGRVYRFSDADPVQLVDVRDTAMLLRDGQFRLCPSGSPGSAVASP